MAIYRDGKLVGGVGGGGGGGLSQSQVDGRIASWARTGEDRPVQLVATLPTAADAESDVIYVRTSDQTEWIKESVVNGITHRESEPNIEGVFSSDLPSPNASDVYFNNTTNRLRRWSGSTWSNRTVLQVFGSTSVAVGGFGTGSPAPIVVDTIGEVVTWLADNGYDSANTYIFYDSATGYPDAVREVVSVTTDDSLVRTKARQNLEFVDSVPAVADAVADVVYVERSDLASWGRETVVVSASITQIAFTGYFITYNNRGVFNADADVSSPVLNDIFFSLSRNSFRLYNGTTWTDRTITQVTSSGHVGVGIGSVNPPVTIDTESEVAAYFALNGFNSGNTYLIYLASLDEVREATGYTPSVYYGEGGAEITEMPAGNSFYDYADRTVVAIADRDTAAELTVENDTGTVYDLHIERNSDLIHLVDVDTGTQVRLSESNTLWLGRVDSFTKSGNVWTFKIDFYIRRSTFTTGENIHIEFGAIPHSRTSFFYGDGPNRACACCFI